ncbi:MAG: DNA cytosine methyltransferase [Gemmatimonadetes bacterium]|nr:DNA cytosine methyltransferase [Gemmatimonadota bacterium]
MRVHVYEAGRDVESGGVDHSQGRSAGEEAKRRDLVPDDAEVGSERRIAGAVQNHSAADDQVELLRSCRSGPGTDRERSEKRAADTHCDRGDDPPHRRRRLYRGQEDHAEYLTFRLRDASGRGYVGSSRFKDEGGNPSEAPSNELPLSVRDSSRSITPATGSTDFGALGYRMHARVLKAPDYGLPQRRERAFLVCLPTELRTFDYPSSRTARDHPRGGSRGSAARASGSPRHGSHAAHGWRLAHGPDGPQYAHASRFGKRSAQHRRLYARRRHGAGDVPGSTAFRARLARRRRHDRDLGLARASDARGP